MGLEPTLPVTQSVTRPGPPRLWALKIPVSSAPGMPTLPAAGVIATSPATHPEAAPSIEGLPLNSHSPKVHASTAQAVARNVFMNASAAEPLASSADPALKPNRAHHRSGGPRLVIAG